MIARLVTVFSHQSQNCVIDVYKRKKILMRIFQYGKCFLYLMILHIFVVRQT